MAVYKSIPRDERASAAPQRPQPTATAPIEEAPLAQNVPTSTIAMIPPNTTTMAEETVPDGSTQIVLDAEGPADWVTAPPPGVAAEQAPAQPAAPSAATTRPANTVTSRPTVAATRRTAEAPRPVQRQVLSQPAERRATARVAATTSVSRPVPADRARPRQRISQPEATTVLLGRLRRTGYYDVPPECITVGDSYYRNEGYTVEIRARSCRGDGVDAGKLLGVWRVDAYTGESFVQNGRGRFVDPT